MPVTRKIKSAERAKEIPGGERISAVICTYNEEENIAACIESVAGVDEVVVSDDYSTDSTRKIARSLGARVFLRSKEGGGSRLGGALVTRKDVRLFRERFGWDPAFHAGDRVGNGADKAREAVGHVRNDWVISPDADERVTWDLPELRKLLPNCDRVEHEFVHSHDAEGRPHRVSTISKLFRKSKTDFGGRTHTCILPTGTVLRTNLLRVDHYQKQGHGQPHVLPTMEYSVLHDDDQRSRFYLGREYYYYKKYDRALKLLNLYLRDATGHVHEVAQAWLYAARCYWEGGAGLQGDQARESCLKAVLINPEHKEALLLMSEMYHEPWKHKWLRHSQVATDEDVLF